MVISDAVRANITEAADAGDGAGVLAIDGLARELADRIGGTTLSFDRERFLIDCGINPQS